MLTIIAAMGQNSAIGKDNKLLWHLPDDFKHFKRLTTGKAIIMGRKTFESLPRVLPNRRHIVLSQQKNLALPDGVAIAQNWQEALELVQGSAFIIGGAQIYQQAMAFAHVIELTRVEVAPLADAFFPKIDEKQWQLVRKEYHPTDERHAYGFWFETYHRRGIIS